jgi:hypothetical protein
MACVWYLMFGNSAQSEVFYREDILQRTHFDL